MNILISGKQRSGKDFTASFIEEYTQGQFKRVGLADALKNEYSQITGIPRDCIEVIKNISSIRQQLILLGQARKKDGNRNYWLDQVPKSGALIADVRYTEEVDYFKDAIKIRIECPREIRAQRGTLTNETHPSECELDSYDNWDYMIDGSKPKTEVTEQITKIINQILGGNSNIS